MIDFIWIGERTFTPAGTTHIYSIRYNSPYYQCCYFIVIIITNVVVLLYILQEILLKNRIPHL